MPYGPKGGVKAPGRGEVLESNSASFPGSPNDSPISCHRGSDAQLLVKAAPPHVGAKKRQAWKRLTENPAIKRLPNSDLMIVPCFCSVWSRFVLMIDDTEDVF